MSCVTEPVLDSERPGTGAGRRATGDWWRDGTPAPRGEMKKKKTFRTGFRIRANICRGAPPDLIRGRVSWDVNSESKSFNPFVPSCSCTLHIGREVSFFLSFFLFILLFLIFSTTSSSSSFSIFVCVCVWFFCHYLASFSLFYIYIFLFFFLGDRGGGLELTWSSFSSSSEWKETREKKAEEVEEEEEEEEEEEVEAEVQRSFGFSGSHIRGDNSLFFLL